MKALGITALMVAAALLMPRRDAPAATAGRDLLLVVYSSADGINYHLGRYIASFKVHGYADEKACQAAGAAATGHDGFTGQVLRDQSRALPIYTCEAPK